MKNIIFAILLLSGCSTFPSSELHESEKEDYYAIYSSLLGINENRHIYIDSQGVSRSDPLKQFKELEEIYSRYIESQGWAKFSQEQAKVIMFFAFYAENRGSGAFSEYLASDLKPLYSQNRLIFLESMNELPFLIPSVCSRLNAFFGFEGKNASGKEDFIRENKDHFHLILSTQQAKICLAQFQK